VTPLGWLAASSATASCTTKAAPTGTVAIERWNAVARAKYHHTVTPIRSTVRDGATIVVVGRVAGGFPNSPIELDHIFRLEGDRISSLDIG